MTEVQLELLKASIDEVVRLETGEGERFLAKVMVVFDEGETPDMFCLKVERGADGGYVTREGCSLLLSEIATVEQVD